MFVDVKYLSIERGFDIAAQINKKVIWLMILLFINSKVAGKRY